MLLKHLNKYDLGEAYYYALRNKKKRDFQAGFLRGSTIAVRASNIHCARTGQRSTALAHRLTRTYPIG